MVIVIVAVVHAFSLSQVEQIESLVTVFVTTTKLYSISGLSRLMRYM